MLALFPARTDLTPTFVHYLTNVIAPACLDEFPLPAQTSRRPRRPRQTSLVVPVAAGYGKHYRFRCNGLPTCTTLQSLSACRPSSPPVHRLQETDETLRATPARESSEILSPQK